MAGDEVFRIVVGVDGSAPSRLALEWAVTEARLRHGQLNAVTAWEFPPVTVGMERLIQDAAVSPGCCSAPCRHRSFITRPVPCLWSGHGPAHRYEPAVAPAGHAKRTGQRP